MSLNIEDGFDFTIGQWIADATITILGLIVVFAIVAVFYACVALREWVDKRRFRR